MRQKFGVYRLLENENGYWLLIGLKDSIDLTYSWNHVPISKEAFDKLFEEKNLDETASVREVAKLYKETGDWAMALRAATSPILS